MLRGYSEAVSVLLRLAGLGGGDGAPSYTPQQLAPTMQVIQQLPDEELQASSFVAVLGKPYKAEDLAGLLCLARAIAQSRPSHSSAPGPPCPSSPGAGQEAVQL